MTIEDPQGRVIRLPDERWMHITRPTHSYMVTMRELVVGTLQNADVIRKSSSAPDTVRLYYKWFDETAVGPRWICVVVKLIGADAFVMTAYATSRLKAGEQIWDSRTR